MTALPRPPRTSRRLTLVSDKKDAKCKAVTAKVAEGQLVASSKGFFTTSDGVQLYYEDSGGSGLPLLYVYGLGCSIRHWKYSLAFFGDDDLAKELHSADRAQARRRQIWLDLRGHGQSEPPHPGQRLRIDLITRDLKELCDFLKVTRTIVLGQSMGGSIAMHLAHTFPTLVASLVLLTSPGRDPTENLPLNPVSRYVWLGMIALNNQSSLAIRALYATVQGYARLPLVSAFSGLILREIVRKQGFNPQLARTEDIEEYITKIFSVRADLFYDMADDLRLFDIADYQPPIMCPSLVIAGARDQIIPLRESRRLVRNLPKGELAVVRHGSHCPHFDDPSYVNKLIDSFLDENKL